MGRPISKSISDMGTPSLQWEGTRRFSRGPAKARPAFEDLRKLYRMLKPGTIIDH
jgi:hypothetical protein